MTLSPAGGRIRESSIEALRERMNLIEVVSQTVSLRRSGTRFMGQCPFHEDSSPSFLVDDKHYHCFGCKAHGDAISFEMGRTGCSFVEAVESLANRFRFALEYENQGKESESERKSREQNKSVAHIMSEVTKAYAQYLWSAEGRTALDYLRKRGFSDDSIKDWQLGLAPRQSSLVRLAELRGWDQHHLGVAGLIRQREGAREWYDFFRDRIMIPIRDEKGRPVAFGGRIYRQPADDKNPGPKYLNSPETPLFQKSKTLFNFYRARTAIVQCETAVVVEGYMDCLAIARAGIQNVVAVLGTALTPEHLRKLSRLTRRVILCFDSDSAGREAARKAFEVGFPLNLVELQYMSVPSGKDPDDFLQEHGAEAFSALISKAVPLASWVCDYYLAQGTTREAQIRRLKSDFVSVVLRNPDPAVREVTLQTATTALGLSQVSSLTSGVETKLSAKPISKMEMDEGKSAHPSNSAQYHEPGMQTFDADSVAENFSVSTSDEAAFYLSVCHAPFSVFPSRLKNVLRGEQGDEPMDEIVLAQCFSSPMVGSLVRIFLSWSEIQLLQEDEIALVDARESTLAQLHPRVKQLRALATLDPESLLESGLETWIRGVLETSESQRIAPKLRNLSDLKDPLNLPFVRMIVRDAKVSRARSNLTAMLSRTLANIEILYLDHEIERTTRELRGSESVNTMPTSERDGLEQRLRKLSAERTRRYQKFILRMIP